MGTAAVDIDGVLAEEGDPANYGRARPLARGIELVRRLTEAGHRVVLHTARWEEDRAVTMVWLAMHDVPYDKLVLGKPKADLYVDDRAWIWDDSAAGDVGEVLAALEG